MKKMIIILLSIVIYCACNKDDNYQITKPEVSFSEFTDTRDQSVYKCITIGEQTWMAENLKYRLPMGAMDGCYTFGEKKVELSNLKIDYSLYQDSLKLAINRGEVIDPEGAPLFQRPSFLLVMYFDIVKNTADYMEMVSSAFPDVVPLLTRIYDNLIPVAITVEMEKTDSENGGYYRGNGFLYTYNGALSAIPEGWRLPTDDDWKKLEKTLGMPLAEIEKLDEWRGEEEATFLKKDGDDCGFAAIYSGAKVYGVFPTGTPFIDKGAQAFFWSSTKLVENDTIDYGITRILSVAKNQILRGTSKLTAAYSVRCIKE